MVAFPAGSQCNCDRIARNSCQEPIEAIEHPIGSAQPPSSPPLVLPSRPFQAPLLGLTRCILYSVRGVDRASSSRLYVPRRIRTLNPYDKELLVASNTPQVQHPRASANPSATPGWMSLAQLATVAWDDVPLRLPSVCMYDHRDSGVVHAARS